MNEPQQLPAGGAPPQLVQRAAREVLSRIEPIQPPVDKELVRRIRDIRQEPDDRKRIARRIALAKEMLEQSKQKHKTQQKRLAAFKDSQPEPQVRLSEEAERENQATQQEIAGILRAKRKKTAQKAKRELAGEQDQKPGKRTWMRI